MPRYSVAKDFSRTPGPRYESEGKYSGQMLRKRVIQFIREAEVKGEKLHIDLDGTAGYGTSFLEEAFGGLVRHDGLSPAELRALIEFKSSEEEYLIDDIYSYWTDAQAAREIEGLRNG